MSTTRLNIDLNDPATLPKGRIDPAVVDSTTEEEIAMQQQEDDAEAMQDMARYARRIRRRNRAGNSVKANGIDGALEREVAGLIGLEATLLDRRRWKEWLDLYAEDAVFWAPAWASEEETTTDPETQLNLIYLKGRGRLEDRVFRIESRQSWASLPLDRTVHVVGNVRVEGAEGDAVAATANCIVHVYGKKGPQTRGSRYDFVLRRIAGALKIARKKIVFIDDRLEGPVDIYHL